MSFGIAILRAVVGGLFIGHGLQKLLGKFGGGGLEGTAGFFESLGLRPGKVHAYTAGVAETAGGAMLAVGALTPVAASALTGTMTVAIQKVHGQNGPWAQDGGYEYPLTLTAALFAITASGPGSLSLDRREWGAGWAALAIASGVAGAYGMLEVAKRQPEPPASAPEPEPAAA
jgi:putative oxidoreductase